MRHSHLYETHINTKDLSKAVEFYQTLGLELAHIIPDRKVAFFWLGDPSEKAQMLGIWEVPDHQFSRSHFALGVTYDELLSVPEFLSNLGIELSASFGLDTSEPIVHTWMPAASYYFADPDGNSLEYITVLDQNSNLELPIMHLSKWEEINTVKNVNNQEASHKVKD
ncbi:VOC family protein [Cytobacillus dafuensis]|uniref:VOC family protein n=1 Tax=Cytobacillus dafuensis TaxID=1742359 RepID=UPI000AFC8E63|nr:VOC family protein [Cytobacillus dafuensis]